MPIPSHIADHPMLDHLLSCIISLATLHRDLDPPDSVVPSAYVQTALEAAYDHAAAALAALLAPSND